MMTMILGICYILSASCFLIAAIRYRVRALFFAKAAGFMGLLFHTIFIILRGIQTHRLPLTNTYETLMLFSWLVMAIYLFFLLRYNFLWVGVISGVLAFSLLLISNFVSSQIEPLMPSLRSSWLFLHVVSYFISYACFAISFGLSLVFITLTIIGKGEVRRVDLGESLESLIFKIIDMGFPFLTLGIVTGAVWANITWGRYWNWDPKETWALVTWLIYAACLHMRHTRNLRGLPAAVVVAMGFAAVMFTYIGVNYWLATVHAYA